VLIDLVFFSIERQQMPIGINVHHAMGLGE